MELLKQIPVQVVGGSPLTLGAVADIRLEETPPGIEHEAGRRRTFISANVRDRDVASFVRDAQRSVAREVELLAGYTLRWGGDFENLQTHRQCATAAAGPPTSIGALPGPPTEKRA